MQGMRFFVPYRTTALRLRSLYGLASTLTAIGGERCYIHVFSFSGKYGSWLDFKFSHLYYIFCYTCTCAIITPLEARGFIRKNVVVTLVEYLAEYVIVQVTGGDFQTTAIPDAGEIFMWGSFDCLGLQKILAAVPNHDLSQNTVTPGNTSCAQASKIDSYNISIVSYLLYQWVRL